MSELPAVSVYYIDKSLEMLNRATILHEKLGYIGSVGLVYYSCLHICAAFVGIDKPTLAKVHAKEIHRAYKRKYNSSIYPLMDNGTNSLSYWKGLREYSYYNHYHDNNFKNTEYKFFDKRLYSLLFLQILKYIIKWICKFIL